MKKTLLICLMYLMSHLVFANDWVRVNQIGYLTDDIKNAVYVSDTKTEIKEFKLVNTKTGVANVITTVTADLAQAPFKQCARLSFTNITTPGTYYIEANGAKSPTFKIGDDIYAGTQEIPLKYMRQQRCGYNPFLKAKCHTHDGRIVCHPTRTGEYIDVTGGWHDASDYLQYLTTSANATYQMLFAYKMYPYGWADKYDAAGNLGANGIPDILDEAKWGLEWMNKMNPEEGLFFNQIADDRDHREAGLPNEDTVDYGWGAGMERPVFVCEGKPQGLAKNMNRSTGLASSVAKYASAFTLGSELLKKYYPEFCDTIRNKANNAYSVAVANPGACQTACTISPYFYEEDNWADDLELAAATLYHDTKNRKYLEDAVSYGRLEPVTPWMGADSARHYQWYPFTNIGHFLLADQNDNKVSAEFIRNLRSGLQRVSDRAKGNAFCHGIPFIWCSNNLTVGFVTQACLYRKLTGDTQFQEIETSMRDWLLGCNPWGKAMIIGINENADYPTDPHSPLSNLKAYKIDGGLVDGPVYGNIFKLLRGVHLRNADKYAPFQSDFVVYHDDYSDYSTNEPTMDGTASMSYMFATLANHAITKKKASSHQSKSIKATPKAKK